MDKIEYYICLCLMLPIIMLCFYLEKRARRIIISMICGVLAGLVAYYINTPLYKVLEMTKDTYSTTVGPIVEEILKFIPVIIIAFAVKKGKRGSAANAYSVGLGFCVAENLYYLVSNLETASVGWIIVRCIGTGVMHSMTTTINGMGIYSARTSEKFKVLRIIGGFVCAVAFHLIYNNLVSLEPLKLLGVLLPVIVFFTLFVIIKKESLRQFLWDNEEIKKDGEAKE